MTRHGPLGGLSGVLEPRNGHWIEPDADWSVCYERPSLGWGDYTKSTRDKCDRSGVFRLPTHPKTERIRGETHTMGTHPTRGSPHPWVPPPRGCHVGGVSQQGVSIDTLVEVAGWQGKPQCVTKGVTKGVT